MDRERIIAAVLAGLVVFTINGSATADIAPPVDTGATPSDSESGSAVDAGKDSESGAGDTSEDGDDTDEGDEKGDGSCSFAPGSSRHSGAEWLLVGVLIGLGLIIRDRSRR